MCGSDLFLAILAVFFPPISVWIKVGICTADSLINIALCCLGYVPGLLHAWYIILKYPEPDIDDPNYAPIRGDVEDGRVTYYVVAHEHAPSHSQRNYGTVESHPPQQHPSPQYSQQQQNADTAGSSSQDAQETRAPPTYAEAVRGDYKIQSHD